MFAHMSAQSGVSAVQFTILVPVWLLLAACQAPPPPRGVAAAEDPARRVPPVLIAADTKESPPAPTPALAPRAVENPAPDLAPGGSTLRDPALATEVAPERFTVLFQTTKGDLNLDVRRSWAPRGADRLYNLVKAGYFDGNTFFRVVPDFVAQVGIHGDPEVNRAWRARVIEDDPVAQSNIRGMVSFAATGKRSRTTQIFINLSDNPGLDRLGFAPLGRVRELEVAKKLYGAYGEAAPQGRGPSQIRLAREGNTYLKTAFPALDSIVRATITDLKPGPAANAR